MLVWVGRSLYERAFLFADRDTLNSGPLALACIRALQVTCIAHLLLRGGAVRSKQGEARPRCRSARNLRFPASTIPTIQGNCSMVTGVRKQSA